MSWRVVRARGQCPPVPGIKGREIAAALAPQATIDVLQATNSAASFYDIIHQFVKADTDKTLSISWGLREDEANPGTMTSVEHLIEEADAQDQTVVAAAGDDGATDCFYENGDGAITDHTSTLNVNFPASSPYAISVGGTSTTLTGNDEAVWNDSDIHAGAAGGGISTICMPGYQDQAAIPGVINPGDATDVDSSASCPTGHYREVPDVSADADPLTGYIVYIDGQGGWIPFGGTSAATPLWAAIAALTDASPFCAGYGSGSAGLLPQALYAAVAQSSSYIYGATSVPEVLRDVISGNNDYTPSGDYSGDYSAGPGFDLASGLGTPVVPGYRGGRPTERGCCPSRAATSSGCTPDLPCWPRPPRRAPRPPAR
jgi:kumamolisin